MVETFDFEARLQARLRARATLASRPFDASGIAHEAIAAAPPRRLLGRLEWPSMRPVFAWMIVGLLLAIALLGAVTLAGALQRKPPPVPTSGVSNGWVAFADDQGVRAGEGPSAIYLVKDGVAERPVIGSLGDGSREVCPSFSPDGTRLAYSEARINVTEASLYDVAVVIVTVNAAGMPVGPELRLATPSTDVQDACPEWAPDGQSVAFLTNASGQPPELWIGHLDGTETRVAGWDAIPGGGEFDWSPDGTAVVAVGNDDSSLWIVPVDGGAPRLLTHAAPGVHFHTAQWSPDGTRIAAESYTNPSGSYTVGSIEIYRADGSGSPIELAGGDTSDPSWSPDGRGIAYLQNHSSGPPDIVALMLDTGEVRVLVSHSLLTGGIAGFVWAPDGTRLVLLYGFGDPPAAVFVSVVSDSAPIVLTHTTFDLEGWPDESMISWQSVFP
jgi:dipeptidyl aminopeptidase/acylaminoacyl peptidase